MYNTRFIRALAPTKSESRTSNISNLEQGAASHLYQHLSSTQSRKNEKVGSLNAGRSPLPPPLECDRPSQHKWKALVCVGRCGTEVHGLQEFFWGGGALRISSPLHLPEQLIPLLLQTYPHYMLRELNICRSDYRSETYRSPDSSG